MMVLGQFRSELERSLASKGKGKFTFVDLNVLIEEMLRVHGHQLTDDTEDSNKPVEIGRCQQWER